MKVLECSQLFSHCKGMGIFPDTADNSAVHDSIRLNFELSPEFIVVLHTCKNEEDSIKMKELECSQHNTSIFQTFKGR